MMKRRKKRVMTPNGKVIEITRRELKKNKGYHLIPEELEYAAEFMTKSFTDLSNRDNPRYFRGHMVKSKAITELYKYFGEMELRVFYMPEEKADHFLIICSDDQLEKQFQRLYYQHFLWKEGQKPFKELGTYMRNQGPLLWVPIHAFRVLEELVWN